MKNETLQFKINFLFPLAFRFFGYILILASIFVSIEIWWLGVIMLLLAVFFSFSFESFEFDLSQKQYRRCYVFLFFIKSGSWSTYEAVDKLFLKSSTLSQQINSRVTSGTTVRYIQYKLFVKFGNSKKELVLIKKNKAEILQQGEKLAQFLMCDLQDLSDM